LRTGVACPVAVAVAAVDTQISRYISRATSSSRNAVIPPLSHPIIAHQPTDPSAIARRLDHPYLRQRVELGRAPRLRQNHPEDPRILHRLCDLRRDSAYPLHLVACCLNLRTQFQGCVQYRRVISECLTCGTNHRRTSALTAFADVRAGIFRLLSYSNSLCKSKQPLWQGFSPVFVHGWRQIRAIRIELINAIEKLTKGRG
jgi:hypothetical protein